MSSNMQFLPETLFPITSSIPPHLDLFDDKEVVVKIPDLRWASFAAGPHNSRNTTGWEDVKNQIGTRRNYNRKYRRARDKASEKTHTPARRNNKRPSRQPVPWSPPSPPDSKLYIPTGWESGWTDSDSAQEAIGWSDVDSAQKPIGWSDVDETDQASGWDVTPSHKRDRWTTNRWPVHEPEEADPSWSNHDPFRDASRPDFWTGLSRIWLTDYAMHELTCQIAIDRGEATTRAPFRRHWVRIPEGAEDAWAYEAHAMAEATELLPFDWNQEQAILDRGGYSGFLSEEKADKLVGRDRWDELTEPEVGSSSWGLEEYAPEEERRWWEIADARSPRLQVSWQNIEGAGGRVRR